MALIDYQTVLGRMLREQHGDDHLRGVSLDERESTYVENLRDTTEFRFYASVQRSWCVARATKAAHLTLSLLSPTERQRLLDEWIDSGAGAQSFFFVEADLFLDFLGKRLSDRPRELTMCRFERATLRAGDGANYFVAPDPASLNKPDCFLSRGSYAALVRFTKDAIDVQTQGPLAELFRAGMIVMFSPGLPQLWHEPSTAEVDVWEALDHPAAVRTLLSRGHSRETLDDLLSQGTIEYAD
ncbi:MAG TPA: hypothetical protein VHQ94_05005 [Pyrinomonadaceae bacterium]|jgi:hypothetical protein|nr:hypothetical protein [Pyrinomonadaceae bacterium]